ncbi:hypothetical protein [Mesomycoplasma lagogenitalium]|uniref:Uncharacterized protein n=1 Tax=Mesomycoplasma lagogenitalium TaxID=171286 RepID=A0ABY8LTC4_9BACT|nr:hypothetical protein [Mesomycoplasma lagogenitalium]WGI36500.1 hypothetical protein QEG99_03480 [Mesomycoplasma lagogenitalium]
MLEIYGIYSLIVLAVIITAVLIGFGAWKLQKYIFKKKKEKAKSEAVEEVENLEVRKKDDR